jgi:predicted DNA binding CopG/RHH family protein
MKKTKYTKDESELVESIEKGDWNSLKNLENEKKRYSLIAKNTLRKDKRVNIRISNYDLVKLQDKAVEEGLPYQTLMSSILHKYVTKKFHELR